MKKYTIPELKPEEKLEKRHKLNRSPFFDDMVIRGILTGESGCGKTTFLCSLLPHFNWHQILIYGKCIDKQEPYKRIIKYYEDKDIDLQYQDTFDPLLLENLKNSKNSLVIIDDVELTPKEIEKDIVPLFAYGRHDNISILMIKQYLFDIQPSIRNNTNLYIIFPSSDISTFNRNIALKFKNLEEPYILQRHFKEISKEKHVPMIIYPNSKYEFLKIRKGINGIQKKYL